ncbi:hypothetical protein EVAR_44431_1 [Eumeta japonica]|uniref:Uncharacterized protein n=1 Tax=Eumeta variegata TaxID=151549 RepID=A0A4C1XTY2_EUMVA|nr:hypothetical protein EVAR_44431_1 [Eumeta japonica]
MHRRSIRSMTSAPFFLYFCSCEGQGGAKFMGCPCAWTHGRSVSGVRKLQERSLGAETVRWLGVQTAGSPECVAGMDARGLTAAARLTLRGTPHTHTRAEPDTMERGSKEH